MSRAVRELAGGALSSLLSGVPLELWQQAFPKDVVSLYYHVVSDSDLRHVKLYRYKTPAQFEADLRFAKTRCISFEELHARRDGRINGAPNGMFITFDDGFAECFTTVRPLLLKYAIDAAFFVSTGFLDDVRVFQETIVSLCIDAIERADEEKCAQIVQSMLRKRPLQDERTARQLLRSVRVAEPVPKHRRRLLLWLLDLSPDEQTHREALCDSLGVDPASYVRQRPVFMSAGQVRALASEGFTVGAHGVYHRSLQARSDEDIVDEIVSSCTTIRDITDQKRVPFAFPYNGLGISRSLLRSVRCEYPFIDLFFDSGMLRKEPPFVVSRISADDPMSGLETTLPYALSRAWAKPTSWYSSNGVTWTEDVRRKRIPTSSIRPL